MLDRPCTKCGSPPDEASFNYDLKRMTRHAWCKRCERVLSGTYPKDRERERLRHEVFRNTHRDQYRASARVWYHRHKEQAAAIRHKWQVNNKERVREIDRAGQKRRITKVLEKNRHRVLSKKGIPGFISLAEWEQIKATYFYRCLRCGRHDSERKLTRDHVIPITRLGCSDSIANIQPLCGPCNSTKGTKTIDFRERINDCAFI